MRLDLGFRAEPLEKIALAAKMWGQDFQRDGSIKLDVVGLVDNAHAAIAETIHDQVMAETVARFERLDRRILDPSARGELRAPFAKAVSDDYRALRLVGRFCIHAMAFSVLLRKPAEGPPGTGHSIYSR